MSYVGTELRELRREVTRLNRRLAMQRMGGKVVQRDATTRKVRLELGEDPTSNEKVLSPWVRVQALSAGDFKMFRLPSMGEQGYVESPSGVLGADSLFTSGSHDGESPHPVQDADEFVIERGAARFSMTGQAVKLAFGSQGFRLDAAGLAMLGKLIAKGGSRPAHYVGGADSDGDKAVDGNDQILI